MNCPRCGAPNLKAFVDIRISVDFEDHSAITKKVIAKKTTELISKNPDSIRFRCTKCLYNL
jgi:hypothetical protein